MIEAHGLSKSFMARRNNRRYKVDAVREVELRVEPGEIFGFLGPNGAGKSTTVKMLSTLLAPDAGQIEVAGFDLRKEPVEVRRHIGYVSQAGGTDRWGTARENMVLQARLYGIAQREARERADALIESLEMEEFADRRASGYSGGQRRKLDLAIGMVHRPELLFLDEPTTGLDPVSRAQLWERIRGLRSAGTTIFLTTHYLDEADQLCDRVAIIDRGQIVVDGTPSHLKRKLSGDVVTLRTAIRDDIDSLARELLEPIEQVREIASGPDGTLRLTVHNGEEAVPEILRRLSSNEVGVTTISLARPTLDDVFLKLTGHSLAGETAPTIGHGEPAVSGTN